MTEKALDEKILEWLGGQGYGLEMKVAASLGAVGFEVLKSSFYLDPETGVSREIDVVGRITDIHGLLNVYSVVECKKSAKPWVLFTSKDAGFNRVWSFGIMTEAASDALVEHLSCLAEKIDWFRKDGGLAYGITEAFTSKQDNAFQAARAATKAAIAYLEEESLEQRWFERLSFFFPTVVLDAPLFECFLESDGEPVVSEIDSAFLNFPIQVGQRRGASVQIVTLKSLDNYCKDIKSVFYSLRAELAEPIAKLANSIGMPLVDDPPLMHGA